MQRFQTGPGQDGIDVEVKWPISRAFSAEDGKRMEGGEESLDM